MPQQSRKSHHPKPSPNVAQNSADGTKHQADNEFSGSLKSLLAPPAFPQTGTSSKRVSLGGCLVNFISYTNTLRRVNDALARFHKSPVSRAAREVRRQGPAGLGCWQELS